MDIRHIICIMDKQKKGLNPWLVMVRLGMAATFVLIVLLILNHFKIINLEGIVKRASEIAQFNFPSSQNIDDQAKIIMKVGQENIYQKDLDTEEKAFPPIKNVDKKKLLLDKIAKDSILLQGARDDGIVNLDTSVFNSPQKDYAKRIDLIGAIKKKIDEKSDNLTGAIVSIWFYNKAPGRVGYEKGRKLALAAITKIHDDVVKKKLTIEQAGQAIRNDPLLGRVDPAYLNNALLKFSKSPSQSLIFDPGFDAIIKKLTTGAVSNVYLAKTKQWQNGQPTDSMIDSVYMFAQVTARKKSTNSGYDDWYSQKAKSYAVTIY